MVLPIGLKGKLDLKYLQAASVASEAFADWHKNLSPILFVMHFLTLLKGEANRLCP